MARPGGYDTRPPRIYEGRSYMQNQSIARRPRRRSHGEGTVYKRKDGRWVARLILVDGTRKDFYAYTRNQALQRLADVPAPLVKVCGCPTCARQRRRREQADAYNAERKAARERREAERAARVASQPATHSQKRSRPAATSRSVSNGLRYSILERDGFRCQTCGRSAKDGATLNVDHRIPVARGGSNQPDNLWTLCAECNWGKHVRLVPEDFPS